MESEPEVGAGPIRVPMSTFSKWLLGGLGSVLLFLMGKWADGVDDTQKLARVLELRIQIVEITQKQQVSNQDKMISQLEKQGEQQQLMNDQLYNINQTLKGRRPR